MDTAVSSNLMAQFASGAATLAWYWIVRRADGTNYGWTSHIVEQEINSAITAPFADGATIGFVLCVPIAGFSASDVSSNDALAQNNLDITSVLNAVGITRKEIRGKLWENAQFEIGVINFRAPADGTKVQLMGTLGSFTTGDQTVQIEQRGLTQPLEAQMDGLVGPMCRVAVFSQGVRKCNLDPTPFIRTGTISTIVADRQFVDTARTEADGWWTKGIVKFTSGACAGQSFEIKSSTAAGVFVLAEEAFFGLADGDAYSMTPGCNKLLKIQTGTADDGTPIYEYIGDCKAKFNNVINMQAEPEVPGTAAIQKYGGQAIAPASAA